ncbi:MAG TPA: ABC transporter substrate-binding protein, partial [Anaerovoracaceae bacterium]|nr:ABC transporter substrate-binding protein [Anaerovoracaceae bacterium]
AIILIAGSLAGCGGSGPSEPAETGSGESITVGIALPTSGSLAMLGSQAFNGAEIARQMINERGGVNGQEVEFAKADAPDTTAASTEANRLIDQHKVTAIIGSLSSGNGLAISSVTERSGVVLWETSAISDDITNAGGKYIFRTCESGSLRGYYGMQFVSEVLADKLGIPAQDLKIALINEDSSYGQSISEGAEQGAGEFNLNIVAHETYNKDITDLSATVVRIKEQQPDIIFAVSYVNDAVLLYDTLKQLDAMPKVLIGGGSGFTDLNFNEVFGAEANGVFCIDMPTNVPPTAFKNEETKEIQAEFRSRFLEANKDLKSVPLTAEVLFAGTWVLLHDVLPNAKSMSPDDIAAAARALKLDETTMGWGVEFGPNGQNKIAVPAISQWQDGATRTVWPDNLKVSDIMYLPLNEQ